MASIARWIFTVALVGMTFPSIAGEPVKQEQMKHGEEQMKRRAAFLCGQVRLTGSAGGSYANQQACNAARPGLERDAKTDGNDQCTDLCNDMGCSATTVPNPLPAASSCRGPDPANQKFYGLANTGPFDCKCNNP